MPSPAAPAKAFLLISMSLVAVSVVAVVAEGTGPSPPILEYTRNPETVILFYQEQVGELEVPDGERQWLRVYGDGRVVVHRPPYMKCAGEHVYHLDEKDMHVLLSTIGRAVIGCDAAAIAREKRAEEARRRVATGELFAVSDVSTAVFELRLERYQGESNDPVRVDVDERLAWPGLWSDAERFPGIAGMRRLAAAHAALRQLMDRPLTELEER